MEGVSESTLLSIARKIVDKDKFLALADKLNIRPESATNHWRTNGMFGQMTTNGTLDMLHEWKQDTIASEQCSQLKKALVDAGYKAIAKEHFGHINEGESGRKRPAETQHQEAPVAKKISARKEVPETAVKPEDELDPGEEVLPDDEGSYKVHTIKAAKPTDEQLDENKNYFMARSDKGIVFILNNFCGSDIDEKRIRRGSAVDTKNIRHVFTEIGYEAVIERDLTSTEITESLDYLISKKIKKDHTSVVLVLMSHGNETGVFGTDEKVVSLQDIKEKFYATKCPALQDKPKIILIQACRGRKITPSVKTDDELPSTAESSGEGDNPGIGEAEPSAGKKQVVKVEIHYDRTPDNADFIVANATSAGYYSYRSTLKGSWFIQVLCEQLIAKAHKQDLDTILEAVTVQVKTHVAIPHVKDRPTESTEWSQQTISITKQGIGKKIFFLPKYPANEEA